MPRLLVATTNAGKAREFAELLSGDGLAFDSLASRPGAPEIAETGRSFLANASLKASGYAKHLSTWAIADDSGLCVDALGGKPGIFSARWSVLHDEDAGDLANNRLLLRQMQGVIDRSASFVCALALADPDGRIVLTTQGQMPGSIAIAPRGTNGFGYDPLFIVSGTETTSAELSSNAKHAISHRGNALRSMRELIRRTSAMESSPV